MSTLATSAYREAFRRAVLAIIEQHLGPVVASRFKPIYEVENFSSDNENIWRQSREEHFILEVYYEGQDGLMTYITDVASFWSRKAVEYQLLRGITDKLKSGAIGSDWVVASDDIKTGKHATADDEGKEVN